MEPLALSITDTGKAIGGVSRWKVYDLIKEGKLEKVEIGGRSVVKMSSIRRLIGEEAA